MYVCSSEFVNRDFTSSINLRSHLVTWKYYGVIWDVLKTKRDSTKLAIDIVPILNAFKHYLTLFLNRYIFVNFELGWVQRFRETHKDGLDNLGGNNQESTLIRANFYIITFFQNLYSHLFHPFHPLLESLSHGPPQGVRPLEDFRCKDLFITNIVCNVPKLFMVLANIQHTSVFYH